MQQLNYIKQLDIPIVSKSVELFKINQKLILKFPKFSRHSLGEKILSNNLEILELCFKTSIATKYQKEKYVLEAQAKNELLKILIRISHQSEYIDQRKYLEIQSLLNEIGKMLSGWLKYTRNN